MSHGIRNVKESKEMVANRRLSRGKDPKDRGLGYWGAVDYVARQKRNANKGN